MQRYFLYALIVSGIVLAQSEKKLEFEVVSVRPSGPLEPGARETMRISGGPGTDDPGRVIYSRILMRNLINLAYGVGFDQISGPDWVTNGRSLYGANADPQGTTPYDIAAKVPAGTTKEQIAGMLQNLLADRFQLTMHHATKEFSGYALVIAKGGSKLTASAGPLLDAEKSPESAAPKSPSGNTEVSMELEKDGFPRLFPGRNMGGRYEGDFPARSVGAPYDGDTVLIRFRDYPLFDLVQQLSSALTARVVDQTGMTGKYDFTLKFAVPQGAFMVGFGVISPFPPGQPWKGSVTPPALAQVDSVPIISAAMEKQLGLKLQAAKFPMDTLVIDHIERVPTDN